jgi:hypothetical protein
VFERFTERARQVVVFARVGLVRIGPSPRPLVVALVVAALGFPLGLLAGWLIWA